MAKEKLEKLQSATKGAMPGTLTISDRVLVQKAATRYSDLA